MVLLIDVVSRNGANVVEPVAIRVVGVQDGVAGLLCCSAQLA
eukprot:SAG11_NODE_52_length_19809_cov_14.064231_3_plen_42_part_00